MSPFPFDPDYVLQMLRIEREHRYVLSAYLAQSDDRPCRSLPTVFAIPVARLGHLLLVTGHQLEIASGLQLNSANWPLQYEPCEECGD